MRPPPRWARPLARGSGRVASTAVFDLASYTFPTQAGKSSTASASRARAAPGDGLVLGDMTAGGCEAVQGDADCHDHHRGDANKGSGRANR